MNTSIDPNLYSKIISLVSDNTTWILKLQNSGFSENDKFFNLMREYSKNTSHAGNNPGMAEIVSDEIPLAIQNLYSSDPKVKKFFDEENMQ